MKNLLSLLLVLIITLVSSSSYTQAASPDKSANAEIPVLLYHVVKPDPDPSNPWQFSVSEFEKHMAYLKENGYRTLTMKQYFNILDKKAAMPEKPILLTFDDNSSDFYQYVYPILQQYGMKATQFTVSDWVNGGWNMTSEEMLIIKENGVDIQNHSVSHPFLANLSKEQQYEEINFATSALKELTGKTTDVFAYPYGNYNDETISVLKELGFRGAFKVGGGISTDQSDRYELPRIMILQEHSLEDFIRMVKTGY
ncbi:polysaccharide deacetylase family protein [Mesobacillus foraminis]|uniref:polysaccharide deacetylase family protein n=1 Tax=Mesobacillus foraminis TaxID=279826 RepID=UPI001BE8F5CD|nr:polysaccharide deacetylase family protein [Mesobacillus foraminis]MBT2759577.1 polysaccharide deacetylase family protein [Mesobacillus foraminis]